ncbi:hypothetical protein KUTeg_004991 [Tegillarca granosa]|uniref:Superoxide dismutase copper/zinc binding domain-containing protein n=1 Tax=Tegillarca granosa TaxID=220873 RepID=A0ABQ9FKI7_TEGGR|nr:hypothetical protein KUTeg_004991 [Tegillarca granosa]
MTYKPCFGSSWWSFSVSTSHIYCLFAFVTLGYFYFFDFDMDIRLIIITVLSQTIVISECTTLIANFQMKGIKGTVTFEQTSAGSPTTLTYNIMGLDTQKQWAIHERRIIYNTETKCLPKDIGPSMSSLTGNIPASGNGTETIQASALNDLTTLIGRSIEAGAACATIEEVGEHITAFARFPEEIAGMVTFRQLANQPNGVTEVWTDLFQVKNTGSAGLKNLNWKIHSGKVEADTEYGTIANLASRCSSIGAVYNPTSQSGTCDKNNQQNCPIGDLTGKLGQATIAINKGDYPKGFRDRKLPLSGINSIIGKSIAIYNGNNIISCSNIIQYSKKRASVHISRDGVRAEFTFTQDSPYDVTIVNAHIEGLKGLASGYHIHEWPVPYQMTKDESMCSSAHVSGHFNPFGISPPWLAPGVGTNDQYEIGDLSNKHGALDKLTKLDEVYHDWNLPLFERHSIIGRSLVIHKAGTGARWVCGNVEYAVPVSMTTAEVTFVYPVIGRIMFKQRKNLWYDDTQIFVELNYNNGTVAPSNDHSWHVHVNRTGSDVLVAEKRCKSTAGHFNPFDVDLAGNYNSECKPSNQLRCELGDLSGKHGKLTIRSSSGGMQRAFYTDIDAPLSGPNSFLQRSVVIHGMGGSRIACGNIYEVPKRTVKVDKWSVMTQASVSGSMVFDSETPEFLSGLTSVKVNIQNLDSQASGFHVHDYPLPMTSNAPCSSSGVGGHFNPFMIGMSPPAGNGTDDKYEIGDLSAKYGDPMRDNAVVDKHYTDTNLPLRGPHSITGRSVVIHKTTDGARWVCGNIVEDTTISKATLYEAVAEFKEGTLRGKIHLTQYLYPDGGMSDTGILIDLKYANDDTKKTNGHDWSIHDKPVKTDYDTCSSPGSIYNPFMAQTGKLEKYDIGEGRRFYTDVNLPLTGESTVVGRKSFVIYDQSSSGARLACANIMPYGGVTSEMSFPVGSNPFDRIHMAETLAASLHTESYNIVAEQISQTSTCIKAKIYYFGNDRNALKTKMEQHMKNDDTSMGMYAPKQCSQVSAGVAVYVSMVTMAIVLVLQKLLTL